MSAPRIMRRTLPFQGLRLGTNGLRAGWRLLIFLAVLISCLLGFREVVVHIPTVDRFLQPLREGRLVVSAALIAEFQFVLSLLVAVSVMSRIEGRSLADYGLPVRDALGRYFWQGVVWGLLAVTCVMMLIFAAGGFSFGGLALHGGSLVKYGIGWALVFLMVGFFEELLFRGYLQFTLATAIGFWPSAILLSIVFGFVHLGSRGENWMGGVTAGLFGLFLCSTLRRTGNLWFALGLHASFVYAETFIYSVPNSGFPSYGHLLNSTLQGPRWLTGGSVGPEASVMMFVALALLFMLFEGFGPRATNPN
jgi:uncharacterized protein